MDLLVNLKVLDESIHVKLIFLFLVDDDELFQVQVWLRWFSTIDTFPT